VVAVNDGSNDDDDDNNDNYDDGDGAIWESLDSDAAVVLLCVGCEDEVHLACLGCGGGARRRLLLPSVLPLGYVALKNFLL